MALKRIAVIGGGIIGTAVARELAICQPGSHITLLEKEPVLAAHQSGHNSGVVHAGLYYEPGSLKATLCRRGVELLVKYATNKGLKYRECGKLVVAQNIDEVDRLEAIFERAKANGVPGVRMLDRTDMVEVEPGVRGVMALHSPHTGVIDYAEVTHAFAHDLQEAGGRIMYNSEVASLETGNSEVRVRLALPGAQSSKLTADGGAYDLVVTCAGLQSDRLARSSGLESYPKIVPFTGDYFEIAGEAAEQVRGLIYPVPDPAYPFLGVHLTRTVHGALTLGPNAFLAMRREGYTRGTEGFKASEVISDMAATMGSKGFWKFASQNVKAAVREARTALSPAAFMDEARKYVPTLDTSAARPGMRGIRAQAMHADGRLVDDFVIHGQGRLTQVRNAPSPGATSSMAIAEYVVKEALANVQH